MLKKQGLPASIVLTSSANAVVPKRGSEAYDVSKAALSHLVRELAVGMAPLVRVNGISPATVVKGSTMFPRDRVKASLGKYGISFNDTASEDELRDAPAAFYAHRTLTHVPIDPRDNAELYADALSGRSHTRWLNLPEYLLYRWGAEPVAERTNASHTQLVESSTGEWSREIFHGAALEMTCAPRIVPPGNVLGKVSGPLAKVRGLTDTTLIAPACHDTASAIAGIVEPGEDWAYISCGTWSLVGTLVPTPLNGPAARLDNFTNLAAVGGRTCFHKGINGLWVLKQCMDQWAASGQPWHLTELLQAADLEPVPNDLLDVDDPGLMALGDMPARINAQRRTGACLPGRTP